MPMLSRDTVGLREQFQRATSDSGRYEALDRERFLVNQLERIDEHLRQLGPASQRRAATCERSSFLRARAFRQGREVANAYRFLIDELPNLIGRQELRTRLTHIGTPLAMALNQRLGRIYGGASVALAAFRSVQDQEVADVDLMPVVLAQGEVARHDVFLLPQTRQIGFSVAVDNRDRRRAFATGIQVEVQAQFAGDDALVRTGFGFFGLIPAIEPKRRAWWGFQCPRLRNELRSVDVRGRAVEALRFIIRRL